MKQIGYSIEQFNPPKNTIPEVPTEKRSDPKNPKDIK